MTKRSSKKNQTDSGEVKNAQTPAGKNTNSVYISEMDRYLFKKGTHYELYNKLGAHPSFCNEKYGYHFAVWAPHAKAVHVTGDFNQWDLTATPLYEVSDSGIWEGFVPDVSTGTIYKYAITTQNGISILKADPYAFSSQLRPDTASVTADIRDFHWTDKRWLNKRNSSDIIKQPMSIYEVHLGSWRKNEQTNNNSFYTYIEAAHELADYVKDMGYTHVELLGICEHPLDASWGYQVTGYFSPTSRYGHPKDFMYFVNYLHKSGIGVILDWVPAHFPKDAHGLADFDGQPLYEYEDPRKGEHPEWGTKIFDFGKNEVRNFLISSALYWIEQYHIDGLRVDAVSSILYLDYARKPGQWVPNQFGGNQNFEAVEFLKHLNSIIQTRNPGVMMIAEEATTWPSLTAPAKDGGLSFTFKWNMGWMHDFLEYMQTDPIYRKFRHDLLTFGLTYFTSENYILVLSHDEVVHLKRSMLSKMPGENSDKFAGLKAGYTFMLGHPGKKLLFMGQDFGQWHEWDENVSLDWGLTKRDAHKELQSYVRDLLHLYKKYPALYRLDSDWAGFEWVNANDRDRSILSFIRKDETSQKSLLFIINFTPAEYPLYRIGVPKATRYTLLLDNQRGAYTYPKTFTYMAAEPPAEGQPFSFPYPLDAYATAIFRF